MLQVFTHNLTQKIANRRYIRIFGIVIAIFVAYHALMWFVFTSKLLDIPLPNQIGDLSRIAYQIQSLHPRKNASTLPRKHIEFSDWKGEKIDIVTIGDSFSNGGAGGLNPYYQDFIASHYNCTVLNINPTLFGENSIEAVNALYRSGLLDEIKPKAILIESVGRYITSRYAKPIVWDQNLSRNTIYADLKKGTWGDGKPQKEKPLFISTANYKLPLYNFYYLMSPNAFDYSNAYKLSLKKPLFNVNAASTLLVYEHDITSLGTITPENISIINNNFNHLADLLSNKKIHLYFMAAVDKYDLYHDYLESGSSYGKNPLFDLLRPMEKHYTFIDTKAILSDALQKGQKDIYYADDTHWSYLASDIVIRNVPFKKIIGNTALHSKMLK